MAGMEVTKEDQKNNSLLVAYEKAAERLRGLDPDDLCDRTGAQFDGSAFTVRFIDRLYKIRMPEVEFADADTILIVQVLILHYLTGEGDECDSREMVNFSSIPGGMFYFESFRRRVLDKLIRDFGEDPVQIVEAAEKLGGGKWDDSSSSALIHLFPRIDGVIQVYPEDDEFPAAAHFLFSRSISSFLPVEDIAFVGNYAAGMLSRR